MWIKAVVLSFLALITVGLSSPLDQLHNDDITELKAKISRNEMKVNLDDEIPSTFRLPNDTKPIGYELELTTDINLGNFFFKGVVKIWARIDADETDTITLHFRQTVISKIDLLEPSNSSFLEALEFSEILSHEFLVIKLPTMRLKDEVILIRIEYSGTVRDDGGGFYRAYYDENEKRVWFATTQFEVTDARHAMPCYDEPGIRAPIKLAIIHSKDYEAVANTPVESSIPLTELYQITKFEETPSMQTYLLAFLISPYKYVSNNDTEVVQRIYAKPSSIANGEADFAVGEVKPVLQACEQHFNISYPLSKMDHAAITQVRFHFLLSLSIF